MEAGATWKVMRPSRPVRILSLRRTLATHPHDRLRATSNIAVGKVRTSWDQKLQQRAERAAVLAAQKKIDDEIRTQKRVRRKASPYA